MGKLIFLKSGLYSSVQDLGRIGFRKFGVPISGCMDRQHAALANNLLSEPISAPVIEITLSGPTVIFEENAAVALCGADLSPNIDNKPVSMNKLINIQSGSQLSFGSLKYGARAYLAVKGLKAESIMGSYSQFKDITPKSKIEPGDSFHYTGQFKKLDTYSSVKVDRTHFTSPFLAVYKGPEYELLSGYQQKMLLNSAFEIGSNNRMGYQMNSVSEFENDLHILTSTSIPGTVQLTPDGQLIVLMADGQVTGGYPRVLQLTEKSINRLAQKRTTDQVQFSLAQF